MSDNTFCYDPDEWVLWLIARGIIRIDVSGSPLYPPYSILAHGPLPISVRLVGEDVERHCIGEIGSGAIVECHEDGRRVVRHFDDNGKLEEEWEKEYAMK